MTDKGEEFDALRGLTLALLGVSISSTLASLGGSTQNLRFWWFGFELYNYCPRVEILTNRESQNATAPAHRHYALPIKKTR